MNFKDKIKVELDQTDAAIAAVLLAENAGRLALKALLADKNAEIYGENNKEVSALADAYIKVGNALSFAILDAKKNRGVESTMTLMRSTALAGTVVQAADEVVTATEADE